MKGKDIIQLIQENGLEEFEIQVSSETRGEIFPNVKSFIINGLSDIGNSDKIGILEISEINR